MITKEKYGKEAHDITDPEKTTDLPPYGSRNADPITDSPGSHPIETGVGAALGGAASGMAVGLVAGPIGAVVGAVAGAVAGGLAGKGIGELIDPTTQDNWIREYFGTPEVAKRLQPGHTIEHYRPAYDYGTTAGLRHDRSFDDAESDLRSDWEKRDADTDLTWPTARDAVRDAYERTRKYRSGDKM